MVPTEYSTQLITLAWQLLNANSSFTALVRDGNQVRFDRAQANPYPRKKGVQVGDQVEVEIDCNDESWSGYRADEVYGENATYDPYAATSAWLECTKATLTLAVVGPNELRPPVDAVVAQIKETFRAAGPTWGQTWIVRFAPMVRRDQITAQGRYARGSSRRITMLMLPVEIEVQGNQQLEPES